MINTWSRRDMRFGKAALDGHERKGSAGRVIGVEAGELLLMFEPFRKFAMFPGA
jgi:hypothetical protein